MLIRVNESRFVVARVARPSDSNRTNQKVRRLVVCTCLNQFSILEKLGSVYSFA